MDVSFLVKISSCKSFGLTPAFVLPGCLCAGAAATTAANAVKPAWECRASLKTWEPSERALAPSVQRHMRVLFIVLEQSTVITLTSHSNQVYPLSKSKHSCVDSILRIEFGHPSKLWTVTQLMVLCVTKTSRGIWFSISSSVCLLEASSNKGLMQTLWIRRWRQA